MAKSKHKKNHCKKTAKKTITRQSAHYQEYYEAKDAANLDMTPYYAAYGLYYESVAPGQLGMAMPVLFAAEKLPNGRSFCWAKTANGILTLLITPQLSIDQFLQCLKATPNDRKCEQLKSGIDGLSNCLDLDAIYMHAALVAKNLGIPCPQVFLSSALTDNGSYKYRDGLNGEKSGLILVKAQMNLGQQFKTLTHEMRHKWQHETDPGKYLSDYHSPDYYESEEEQSEQYYLQEAEMDAEAYALAAMHRMYDTPLNWGTLPENTGKILALKAREYLKHPEQYCMPKSA